MSDKNNENLENGLLDNENTEVIQVEKSNNKVNFETLKEAELNEIKLKIEQKKNKKPIYISDISKVPKDKKFSRQAVYKCYNKIQETECFVDGEQAESLLQYHQDYVLKFDHIML